MMLLPILALELIIIVSSAATSNQQQVVPTNVANPSAVSSQPNDGHGAVLHQQPPSLHSLPPMTALSSISSAPPISQASSSSSSPPGVVIMAQTPPLDRQTTPMPQLSSMSPSITSIATSTTTTTTTTPSPSQASSIQPTISADSPPASSTTQSPSSTTAGPLLAPSSTPASPVLNNSPSVINIPSISNSNNSSSSSQFLNLVSSTTLAPASTTTTSRPVASSNNNNITSSANLGPRSQATTATPSIQFIRPKSKFRCSVSFECLNGGFCESKSQTCFCAPGYTGENCGTDVDECKQAVQPPCLNNGTCIDGVNIYSCECPAGFRGDFCQEQVDMCAESTPCQNNAKCINLRTAYECQCEPGWEGKHCELNINDCLLNPCQNNGTCEDLVNGFKCHCGQTGFAGERCELDYDDCADKPCAVMARECIDLHNDFKCICHEGFEGKRCEIDIDECQPNPCLNNGTCEQNSLQIDQGNGSNSQPADLTTSYHEVPVSLLHMGNINTSKIAGFTCQCKPEYYGDRCEEMKKCYTKSRLELCNNDQAECVNQGSSYDCLIHSSFDGTGKNYATYRVQGKLEVHEIHVKYRSLVGGMILSFETTQPGSPVADLQLNRSGMFLSGGPITTHLQPFNIEDYLDGTEREIKLRLDQPTGISGVTLARHHYNLTDFHQEPFKGCLTEVRLDNILVPFYEYGELNHSPFIFIQNELELDTCKTCFDKDCQNGGHCDSSSGIDRCLCPSTFTGLECKIDVDECAKDKPNPCLNGGRCSNLVGGYQCLCKEGYRGEHCQEISNYCKAKQPCGQNGVCKNTNSATVPYHCECKSTHTGLNCQDRRTCKNECHPQLAQCINNVTCACLPGKKEERTMCEYITKCEQIDGELCRNGGLCRNAEMGGYYCDCLEPFHGHICELVLEKSPYDVFLLIGIACVGFLIAAVVIVGLVIFRSVRKARATCGTYSPSTQEKYGNSACDLLKPPQPERLI